MHGWKIIWKLIPAFFLDWGNCPVRYWINLYLNADTVRKLQTYARVPSSLQKKKKLQKIYSVLSRKARVAYILCASKPQLIIQKL